MAVSLLVTAFFFGLPVVQYQTYNQDGVIKGSAGIAYDKQQAKELSAPLTDQYIKKTIEEYQQLFDNPDNVGNDGIETFLIGDAYWDFAAPRTKLLNMAAANYDLPGENSGWNKLPDLDLKDGAKFYQAREQKVNALLNTPARKLSQPQKAYWQRLNSKIDTPLQSGYYEGWEVIITSFELLMFALLAVCIVIAPVFAGEYQAGTDSVILAARYGKTKLIRAKIIAAFIFGLTAFTLHVIAALGIPLIAFGIEGWNLPLQIANTIIPYPYNFLQMVLINLLVIYLVLIAMIGITLLLSSRMKTPYLVLVVLVPLLFIPLFLTPNDTTGLYNLILFLLPYRSTMPELTKYISYQFGGLVLDVTSMRAAVYFLIALLAIPAAGRGFKNHSA